MYLAELRAKIIAPLVSDKYRSWQAQSSPSKPESDNVGRREVKIMLSVQPDMGKMSVGSASLPCFPFSTGRGAGAAIAKSPGCVIRSDSRQLNWMDTDGKVSPVFTGLGVCCPCLATCKHDSRLYIERPVTSFPSMTISYVQRVQRHT